MLAIRNYGYLWERKYFYRGAGSNAGHLRGYNKKHKDGVDFRYQIGIYVLYDKDMNVVYVGQVGSGNKYLFGRLKDHFDDHLWNRWVFFTWFGLRAVNENGSLSQNDKIEKVVRQPLGEALDEIEAVLIQVLEPRLNKQGPKWKDAEEYFQSTDHADNDVSLNELRDELEQQLRDIKKALKVKIE